MDYSQWQRPLAPPAAMRPATMNQSEIDAYYASYYAYYAPSLNPNPSSTSVLLPTRQLPAIEIPPPPPGVDVAYTSAVIPTSSYITVDMSRSYTLNTNAQSLAWREAVRLYGTDPLPITRSMNQGAIVQGNGIVQPHSIYPDFSSTSHIVQPQLPGLKKKPSKKAKVVQSVTCEVCKLKCNGPSVFELHKLGKKHLKNLEKLTTPLPTSNTVSSLPEPTISVPLIKTPLPSVLTSNIVASLPEPTIPVPLIKTPLPLSNIDSSLPEPTIPVPLIGPQENPCKSKAKKKKKKKKKSGESTEDLPSKRQKINGCGAKNESMILCGICNILCNSDKVYSDHITSKKHVARAGKTSVNAVQTLEI